MSETPPFDEALVEFRRFVGEQGFPTDLIWVGRADVTSCRPAWRVRLPVPEANERLARKHYEHGRRQGFGVCLKVAGRVDGRSACFIWLPADENEAGSRFVAGLTLKAAVSQPDGVPVWSWFGWVFCRWLNRRSRSGEYWSFVGMTPAF